MAPDDITLGEVIRRQEKLERWTHNYEGKADSQYAMLQTSISTLTLAFVSKDVYDAQQEALKAEVAAVKETTKWLLRFIFVTVLGAMVISIVSIGGMFGK